MLATRLFKFMGPEGCWSGGVVDLRQAVIVCMSLFRKFIRSAQIDGFVDALRQYYQSKYSIVTINMYDFND